MTTSGPQTTVNFERALGVPGEWAYDGPQRVQAAILHSASAAYNIVGATACTMTTAASDGDPNVPIVAAAGGTGLFAGILCNPKVYASYGTSGGGPLAPTMTLANDWNVELALMGELVVTLANAAAPGDQVMYDTTTGALSSTEATAVFTAAQTTTVITVSAISKGNLGVGSVVNTGALQSIIQSLGSGTGGAGTYNVNTSQSVGSGAMTATSVAPSGKAFVPNCVVDRYAPTGAGLAIVKLTN